MKIRPVTDFPMDAEDKKYFIKSGELRRKGDHDGAHRALCKVKLSPPTLLAMKRTEGADMIRREGYNTTLADKEFGPDWLDRDDL